MTALSRAAATAAAVVALLLSGCTSIPSEGPVQAGPDRALEVEQPGVSVLAPKPSDGASPADVVRGFLVASTDRTDDYSLARLYLSTVAARDWEPEIGVRVYDRPSLEVRSVADGQVEVSFDEVAAIDGLGRFKRLPAPTPTAPLPFPLVRNTGGEWRIAAVPPGLLLTTDDVERTHRPVRVYFLDPDRTIVVPDLLVVPQGPDLATRLVRTLLRGPTPWLAGGVSTAVPAGTRLLGSGVPIRNGVARVDLSAEAAASGGADREALSAQIVWTLRQLSEVREISITVQGAQLRVPDKPAVQSRDAWPGLDPGGLGQGARAYVVTEAGLATFGADDRLSPVPGPIGDGSVPLARPAISLDGDLVAGLSPERSALLRGPLAEEEGQPETVLTGVDLGPPSWDRSGALWTVERGGAAAGTVSVITSEGTASGVPLDGLGDALPQLVRVARDGTRLLAVVLLPDGTESLRAGVIVRESGRPVRVTGLYDVVPAFTDYRDIGWLDAGRVAVVAQEPEGSMQPRLVDLDGYATTTTSPLDAVTLAAAPGALPLLASTERTDESGEVTAQVWRSTGLSWRLVGTGWSPVYPG